MNSPTQQMLSIPVGRFPGQTVFLPSPFRLLDTRVGFPALITPLTPLASNSTTTWPFKHPKTGIPSNAEGVFFLLTAVSLTSGNRFLTLWPAHKSQPPTSSFNFRDVMDVQNIFNVVGTAPTLITGVDSAGISQKGDVKIYLAPDSGATAMDIVIDLFAYTIKSLA